MQIAFPEKNKKAGVAYAVTDDGMELPVVDVTHPAFALDLSESEVDRLLQEYARSVKSQGKLEAFIQSLFLRIMSQRSLIMRGIMAAAGGYMTGISTYLLKLGPDNLGQGYASQIDRQIAGSISGLSVRLRLQDIAHLLADGLAPLLGIGRKSSLHLLNIGGGPAMDSLNALLILQKDRPDLLAGRPVYVHILDLEAAGPNFGRRALHCMASAFVSSTRNTTGPIWGRCGSCSVPSNGTRSWGSRPKAPCLNTVRMKTLPSTCRRCMN